MNDLKRNRGELARALANHKYEVTPGGIVIGAGMNALVAGVFDVEHRRGGDLLSRDLSPNVFTVQGLTHMLATEYASGTQVNQWYVALFEGNVTPNGSTLTGATFDSALTECTSYDEPTRVVFNEAPPAAGSVSNTANRAVFTMNATTTVYGGGLLSVSAKEDASSGSICAAAALFSAPREVVDDDELAVRYTLTLTG